MNIDKEIKIKQEAEKYLKSYDGFSDNTRLTKVDFIAGATSESAKEYWYKQFEKEKIEYAIEHLNKLDSVLTIKCERLKEMASSILKDNVDDFENYNLFNRKIEGVKLAKEEIRRDIKELKIILNETK